MGARRFDVDEDAGRGGALARARFRRFVGHDGDGASGEAHFRGDGAKASAVRAPNLREAVAHLHADHADDEQMRLVAAAERVRQHDRTVYIFADSK